MERGRDIRGNIMRNLKSWRMLFAATVLFVATSPSSAQGDVELPDGDWAHIATGTVFPASIGEFKRTRIYEYDDTGRDASVGFQFQSDAGNLSVTTYVYPRKDGVDCQAEFANVTTNIFEYKGAVITEIGAPSAPWSNSNTSAHYARFAIPEDGLREGMQAVQSDAYLYCPANTAWLVKYRATWFGSAEAFPSILPLLTGINWGEILD